MAESAEFLLNLRNGFIPELNGADQKRRRSVISEKRLDAIGEEELFSEFVRLASKQGKSIPSSIWGLKEGRESRLLHLYLSKKLEDKGLFVRVDVQDRVEATGYSRWYITNAAFLENLPGVDSPADNLLAEIHICRCLNDCGFKISANPKCSGEVVFLAEKDGMHLSVSVCPDLMLKVTDGAADHQLELWEFSGFLQKI